MATVLNPPNSLAIIHRAIIQGLREGAQIVRNFAIMNVTGRVLKRDTGRLASSIHTAVNETGGGGILRVGTQVKYGAYWEYGFSRAAYKIFPKSAKALMFTPKGSANPIWRKSVTIPAGTFAARPWLRPAAKDALPDITRRIKLHVERELRQGFGSVTIDIRVA